MSNPKSSAIRLFQPCDVDAVTDLFIKTFRRDVRTNRAAIARCIAETYLDVWHSSDFAGSLVHVDDRGGANGFLGVIKAELEFNGRRIKAGVFGTFMVAAPQQNAAIGVRLAQTCRSLPLDLLYSDTASPRSLEFARLMRCETMATQSLEWIKIIRPVETAALMMARRLPIGRATLAKVASKIGGVARRGEFDDEAVVLIDEDRFLTLAEELTQDRSIRPCWRSEAMRRLLTLASQKKKNGPIGLYEVKARRGRTAGVFILYAGPTKIAQALQIVARRDSARTVAAAVIGAAKRRGAAALRGYSDSRIIEGLIGEERLFYRHGGAATAFARDPALRAALHRDEVMIGGLVGERWSRLVSDSFEE